MATKKPQPQEQAPIALVMPPNAQQLVGECADTGARVVHVAQTYYRKAAEVIESCGITEAGEPDGKWTTITEQDVPPKARSMLGLT